MIIDPYRFAVAGGGGAAQYWLIGNMMATDGLELSEIELFAGGVQKTISAVTAQVAPGTGSLSFLNNGSAGDGNIVIYTTANLAAGMWFKCELSAAASIDGIKFGTSGNASGLRIPNSCCIYSSTDGTLFELAGHVLVPTAPGINQLTSLLTINPLDYDAAAHRYWRLMGWGFEQANANVEFSELQWFEGATRRDSGITMTTNISGLSLTGINDNDGTTNVSATTANFKLDTSYIGIDFTTPRAIDGIKLGGSNVFARHPFQVGVYWSDDNVTYTFGGHVRSICFPQDDAIGRIISIPQFTSGKTGLARWSTTDKTANVTVAANDGYRANENAAGEQGVRGDTGKASGKWRWRLAVHTQQNVTSTTPNHAIGIRRSDEAIGTAYTAGQTCALNLATGVLTVGSSGASSSGGFTAVIADDIVIYLDMDAKEVRMQLNGVMQNSGNAIFSGFSAGTWHPYVAFLASGNDQDALIGSGITQEQYEPALSGYDPLA